MNPDLKSALFLNKYTLLKSGAKSYFRGLLNNQHLPPEELERLNWKKTKRLLEYAYENVPFYTKRFNSIGLSPHDISRPEYFQQIPVLTRGDLQQEFEDMLSVKVSKRSVRLSTTGGSTGHPVKVYHQKNIVRAAMGWRMQSWWGLSPGIDIASIYRDARTDWKAKLTINAICWPTRRTMLNAAELSDVELEKFIRAYEINRPPLIHGYVNAINYVASWLEDRKRSITPPQAIWVTSAPLTSVQKERIERVFRAPVYDQYGCCEIYWLAAQCPEQDGLHMFTDVRRFEILDDNLYPLLPGNRGQIAVTDLENYSFPLIRYLVGDRGRIRSTACSCGITLPVMDKVMGRVSDNLLMPDGTQISGEFMTTIFDDDPDLVKQFRVKQYKDYSIEIDVIANTSYPEYRSALKQVESEMRNKLGRSIQINMKLTNTIPLTKGKIRFIESELTGGSEASCP